MAKGKSLIIMSRSERTSCAIIYHNSWKRIALLASLVSDSNEVRLIASLSWRFIRKYTKYLLLLITPFSTLANPWLPEVEGWKYNLTYSKFLIPKGVKQEKDLYFMGESKKAVLQQKLAQEYANFTPQINDRKQQIVNLNIANLQAFQANLVAQGLDPATIARRVQTAQQILYDQDQNLQIIYNRLNNSTTATSNEIKQITKLQDHLILSYHSWSAKTSVEYGASENWSYGMNIGRTQGVKKYNNNYKMDEAEIFLKRNLYNENGYIFTLQPKLTMNGPMDNIDFMAMIGKSHLMERKIFDKPIEVFGYSGFGISYFLGDHPIIKQRLHAEITSGIKYNDRTIIMNQESEDFNPELRHTYKRVLRSQFTLAHELRFDSLASHNKIYLALSYFTIDSLKTRRHLSSGYSLGLWLEL